MSATTFAMQHAVVFWCTALGSVHQQGKLSLRGKICFLKTPLQRETEKKRQNTSACSVEENRPGRELLTLSINHLWHFLPSSREMRHHDTEHASTCNCKYVSSILVGSDSMWVSQAHIPEPVPLLLCGTCKVSDHSVTEAGREWAEEVLPPLLPCTDAAHWTWTSLVQEVWGRKMSLSELTEDQWMSFLSVMAFCPYCKWCVQLPPQQSFD